jgi:ribosomal protein S4E
LYNRKATYGDEIMANQSNELKNGDQCLVVGGTHKGKSGIVQDLNTSKTGHITITVLQKNGVRFKTLGKNIIVQADKKG